MLVPTSIPVANFVQKTFEILRVIVPLLQS